MLGFPIFLLLKKKILFNSETNKKFKINKKMTKKK